MLFVLVDALLVCVVDYLVCIVSCSFVWDSRHVRGRLRPWWRRRKGWSFCHHWL